MLEHAHVFGNFYGSPRAPVEAAIDQGNDVLFDIDWQGAQQIRTPRLGQHTLSIFILPPSIRELHRRLVSRGQDSAEVIAKRMQKSWDEISHWDGYDFVLINDDLDETLDQAATIVDRHPPARRNSPGWSNMCAGCKPNSRRCHDTLCAGRDRPAELADDTWVAPDANLIGAGGAGRAGLGLVRLHAARRQRGSSVGAGSNVQENTVMHTDMGYPLVIGAGCTIGHKVMLHGCTIGDNSLIGMGATMLNGAQDRQGTA